MFCIQKLNYYVLCHLFVYRNFKLGKQDGSESYTIANVQNMEADSDSESDDLPVFPTPETDDLPVFPLPQLNEFQLPEETPTPTSASNNADFSSELGSIKLELAKINEHITQVNNQKLEAIKDCFKCSVCLEIKFTSFVFCLECKRLIGCADCITNNLDRCPLCRGPFSTQCASCDEVVPLPPVPMVIPGLQNAMEQAENQ